jgi:hypothetical protein
MGSQGYQFSERIPHLETAGAAHIKVGGLFLCEVDAFTRESTDAQEMNVTACRWKVVTITHAIFLEYLLHYLSPFNPTVRLQKPGQMSAMVDGATESAFWFDRYSWSATFSEEAV